MSTTSLKRKSDLLATTTSDLIFSSDELSLYYDVYYPFHDISNWLVYNTSSLSVPASDVFKNREFSMTLKEDIYLRFKSYATWGEWKKDCVEKYPIKLDIGAIYNISPSIRQSVTNFLPLQKELVFDIDMTDYDDIRKCCDGANICKKCWILMNAAVDVLNVALAEDYNFSNYIFIYSGRRGIHCWISDERAKILNDEARVAVVENLSLVESKGLKINDRDRNNRSLKRAFRILEPYFSKYVESQNLFEHPDLCKKVLSYVSEKLVSSIEGTWKKEKTTSEYKWRQLKKSCDENNIMDIVFAFIYPRLDVNVSKHMNHLLKSPFCVHPKTGRVCVPINPSLKGVDAFDPETVPKIDDLIHGENKPLEPYLKYFKEYVEKMKNVEKENKKKSSRVTDDMMAF